MLMNKMNHAEYMKKIYNQGKFRQLVVSPYASTETHMKRVLLFSDQITEPTWLMNYSKRLALILPHGDNILTVAEEYVEEIMSLTNVYATYFGVFTFTGEKLFTIRRD